MSSRWAMLAVVFLTRTSMGVQFQAVASVAPLLVPDLGLSYAELGWLIGLYMLPGALFALPGGLLGQKLGERRVVIVSLGVMAVGALLTASSTSFAGAAAGRLLSGVGAVLMNILLAKMVADWFVDREMSTAMAVMLTAWPVGLGLAAATLGRLAGVSSWRAAVNVTAAAAAVGLLLMLVFYRDPPPAPRAGASGPGRGRLSGLEIALAVSGGFAWGCFNASLVALIAFGQGLLVARGAPIGEAGAVVSTAIWVTLLSVPAGGVLADRWKRPNALIVGGSLAAGLVTMLLPASPWPLATLIAVGVLAGAPPGALMSLLPRTIPSERLATGFGIYYAVFYLVMVLAQPAAGALRDAFESAAVPVVFTGVLMATTALGLALFRALERRARTV